MHELILHIGRHKTGTTAIQTLLSGNRDALAQRGIYVPLAGLKRPGHQYLAQPMQREALGRSGVDDPNDLDVVRGFHAEVAALAADLAVAVSAESFQNCDPAVVRQAFARYRTRIVVYIRSQLEYLASSYAQRVQATPYRGSLEAYARDIYRPNYFRFLNTWFEQFPRQFMVRRYGAGQLYGGDVVRDFMRHALRLEPAGDFPPAPENDTNPTLNARVLQFKLELNREGLVNADNAYAVYHALPALIRAFPAPRPALTAQVRDSLLEQCQGPDLATALAYFGEEQLFDYSGYEVAEPAVLEDAERRAMRELLQEQLHGVGYSLE